VDVESVAGCLWGGGKGWRERDWGWARVFAAICYTGFQAA